MAIPLLEPTAFKNSHALVIDHGEAAFSQKLKSPEKTTALDSWQKAQETSRLAQDIWRTAERLRGQGMSTPSVVSKIDAKLKQDKISAEEACLQYPRYLEEVAIKNPHIKFQDSLQNGGNKNHSRIISSKFREALNLTADPFRSVCQLPAFSRESISAAPDARTLGYYQLPSALLNSIVNPHQVTKIKAERQADDVLNLNPSLRRVFCERTFYPVFPQLLDEDEKRPITTEMVNEALDHLCPPEKPIEKPLPEKSIWEKIVF